MTTRSKVVFRVTQYASEQPWIVLEPVGGDLAINGLLGLDLNEDTTFDVAEQIAQYLNDHIRCVTLT